MGFIAMTLVYVDLGLALSAQVLMIAQSSMSHHDAERVFQDTSAAVLAARSAISVVVAVKETLLDVDRDICLHTLSSYSVSSRVETSTHDNAKLVADDPLATIAPTRSTVEEARVGVEMTFVQVKVDVRLYSCQCTGASTEGCNAHDYANSVPHESGMAVTPAWTAFIEDRLRTEVALLKADLDISLGETSAS